MGVDICYLQCGQLSVIIEESRWQLPYMVLIQGPRKRYSMTLVKIILPLVCCCYWRLFRSEYRLFLPCPGQTNTFNVILNIIEQIYIYIYIYIYININKYYERKKRRNYISRQACFVNRFTLQGFVYSSGVLYIYIYI